MIDPAMQSATRWNSWSARAQSIFAALASFRIRRPKTTEAKPLGPNQAAAARSRQPSGLRTSESDSASGPHRDQHEQREEVAGRGDLAQEPRRDQGPEDEQGRELQELGHELAEPVERLADLGPDGRHRDPGRERGEELVGVGHRGRS